MPDPDRTAVTPYNFVSLPGRTVPGEEPPDADRYHPDRHTGWFELGLTALTPLYTRAARGVGADFPEPVATAGEGEQKQPADFFHRGDPARKPVLPGSSLRGMFRSVFEILTASRMEFVSERHLFYRSFADAAGDVRRLYTENFDKERLVGGVLMEDEKGLFLRVSTRQPMGFVVISERDLRDRQSWTRERNSVREIRVRVLPTSHRMLNVSHAELSSKGGDAGFLIVPGRDVNKRAWYQVILKPDGAGHEDYRIDADVYEDYQNWGAMAHGQKFPQEERGERKIPRLLKPDAPAFGLRARDGEKRLDAIGANMMMPLRYRHAIHEVAKRSYSNPEAPLDMTQAVFGRIIDPKGPEAERKTKKEQGGNSEPAAEAIASRVFFEDAVCQTPNPWLSGNEGIRTPDILSGPKPTAFQTYLEQPGGDLIHWQHSEARLRGFKRYWHRAPDAAQEALQPPAADLGTQKTRIRPVRETTRFSGRIRFENLTERELGALYASVLLPPNLAHKFGMGKSLGLGSLRVEATRTILFDMRARYSTFALNAGVRSEEETSEILHRAYRAFVAAVAPRGQNTLWGSDRMKALAALLSWRVRLNPEKTRHVSAVQRPENEQWRYRYPLPDPKRAFGSALETRVVPDDIVPMEDEGTPTEPKPEPADAPEPAAAPAQTYRQGAPVTVRIVEKSGFLATVELPDGTRLSKVNAGMCDEGDTIKLRVVKAVNGVIRELRR